MDRDRLPLLSPASAGAAAPAARGVAFFRLGFRPFYLGAAAFGAFAIPMWIAMLLGWSRALPALDPMLWHAHEMLFGFAATVIVGFLLTAGKAWTGLETPRGPALAALASLWLGARVAAWTGPYVLFAVLDVALLPVVAVILADRLLRAGSTRNLVLVLILALLTSANVVFHLSAAGRLAIDPLAALRGALAAIVMIECVIAGRVVPAFTMSANAGLRLKLSPRIEFATLAASALALVLWVFSGPAAWTAAFCVLAALLHVLRQWQWHPLVTRTHPILWILNVGYGWLAIAFALLAAGALGWVNPSLGLHALAVGATGTLIIGMITRTARGHTARPLRASRVEVGAYALIIAAAVLRVLVPLVFPSGYVAWLVAAAACWSIGFVLYLALFGPWLLTPRRDGKDG